MATTLSSVLKKKKAMEGYHPKFDNEDNDPLRNVSGERSYASQGDGAEEYSELRTMLNKKKERERKQREEAEAVRKKQSEERAQKIRIEATKQHTTAMTDFIRSDREKVAESAIPMADAIKKYKEYKKSQQEQQIWEKAKNKIDKEEKESGIDWNNVENQYDEQYDREIIKDYKKKKSDEKKELNKQQAERNKVGVDYGGSFIKYTDIPEMDDFKEQVENGKNKPNAVSGIQVFTPLDYLSKDRRALRRSAKATNDWMNDDEKNVYYYLNGKIGPQAAEKYIDSLQAVLNERSATDIKANAQDFAKKHPVAGVVADALTATSTMAAYPAMVAKYGWSAANGDKDNIDPNNPMFTASVLNEGFQKGVSENESLTTLIPNENIRNFAVGTGMSMAENIGRLPMGAVGLAAAAGGAGLSATKDAAERGGNIQQSLELGAANAAAEAFFEKFSLEGLEKFKTHPGKGVREFLKNVAKQAVTEGSEEVFTEIANTISDQLIMGELSQYNQEYEIYKAKGFSESEARNRAFEDFLKNVAMSGLGGAVSGGIMGAGGQILGNTENNRRLADYGSRLNPDYRDYSEGIDTDRSSYQNEESWKEAVDLQQLAKEYAERQKNKEFIKNRDKAEYDIRMQEWFNRVQAEQSSGSDANEGFQDTQNQMKEEPVQEEPPVQEEEPVQEDWSEQGEQPTQENVQQNTEQNQAEPQTQNVQNPTENVQETADNVQNPVTDTQEAKEYRSGYGKNGGEALVNTYDGSVDVSAYNKAFGRAYDAGYNQIDLDTATHSALMSLLSDQQIEAAYRAGIQDYNLDNQIKPQYTQGQPKEGGLGTVSDYATQDQRNVAEHIGKKTGLKINLVDNLSQENATASYKPGEITININSEDFNGSLSHELTHFIKDTAPESYRLYQEIVTEAQMKTTGKAWEDLVESYTNRYKDAGQDLTRQQVMEEIAADATQKFLNDPDFIDQVVKKDRNLAQKIIDFLSDVIDSIKNLIKTGSTRAAAKNLEQDVQMYEDARYAWLLGLEQGSKDYKAGKERTDNIMQSSKYELNQFGFEEYGEKEKGWWKNNDSIIICNTKQDIADFYRDHVHKKPYARLYIGKIGPELAQRIYKDTGVNTENLNVAITSEFEDSHSNPEKERSRGQIPVTPEILSRLPEIISSYDKVENTTSAKDRKPVLKFEKDINGKNVAVEYVRSKKGMLELQTMYAWENKNSRSVSTTLTMPEKTDPYRTSETYSVITPATKDNIQPGTEKSKTRFQLKEPIEEDMFEAKPERVVGFDEAAAVIMPTTAPQELIEKARDKGLNVIQYDPALENARTEAINNLKDVRFQLDEDSDHDFTERKIMALTMDNQALRDAYDLLQHEFELTSKDELRMEDIKKVAGSILKRYNSKYPQQTVERQLKKLYEYIRSSEQVDGQAVTTAATTIARNILNKSQQLDTERSDQYKDLIKQIRNTKLTISEADKPDLATVDGYTSFRKHNFGRMKLGEGGMSVNSFYTHDLSPSYPELFPPEITHPAEQLIQIATALDTLAPQLKNPYAADMDEMSAIVGQEILDEYFNVRRPSPTFADKKQAQIDRLRSQYQQKMRQYKSDLKKQYNDSLKQIYQENLEKSERLAAAYKNLSQAEQKEMKDYYKKQMDDLRNRKNQSLLAMQQRQNKRINSMREDRKIQENKKIVLKERQTLQNWLLNPTDSKHIPEGLRTAVASFLNGIDFSANDENEAIKTIRTSEWLSAQAAFKQIIDNGGMYTDGTTGDTITMDIDPDIAKRIQELVNKTKGIDKLDDLKSHDMEELKNAIRAMKKAVTEVNDLKSNKKSGELSKLADGIFKDLEQRKNRAEYTGLLGVGDKTANYHMLDPQTMFAQMGDNMKSTYDSLRDGLDKKTEKLRTAQEYVDNIVDKYGITPKDLRKWSGSNAEKQHFDLSGGGIDLTVAQMMSLYELNKRGQARNHLYDRSGGIKQAPTISKGAFSKNGQWTPGHIEKNYRPVKVTKADVENIINHLTTEQKALADGLQQFMGNECASWGNEVTMEMYGYKKFTAQNYFPITTDKNYVATKQGDPGNKASTIKNMGMTKSTTPYANNPVIIEDIFDVFSRQVDNMSTYNGYVIPLADLNKVYNYKDTHGATAYASSIKEEIERTFGKAGNDYIAKLVSDINGTVNKDKSIASQLVSNMKAASVAGNLRVAAQQPTAYIRAAMEISPKYLARGAATITRKGQWDLICKYAPIAQWKDWGFYRMDTSRQMKDIMFNTDSTKQRFVNATMILAEKGDQLAWNRLWRACEYECMDQHPDLKEGTEEFYKQVGKRFSEVVDKTQVVDSILHRTQIMRSQSEINQLATSFMAEPLKTYDMLYRAAADLKNAYTADIKDNEKKTELRKKTRNKAVRAATVFVLTGVATSIAASAVDMLRDDDRDKNSKEKYIDSLKSNIFDNLNLLNNIPWVKEIPSIIAGYTPTRADLSGFEDMIYAWNQIKKLKDGTSKYTPQYVAVYTAQMASKLTGIPIKSLTRDMGAVIDSIFDSAGGKADYTWLKQKYDMGSKENLEMYTKMMIQAHRNGDQDFQKKIKDDLNKAGIDNDTITNKIKTVIKSELIGKDSVNPLVEAAAQAKQSYDLEAYEDAVSQLTSQGYATKIVKSAIDARIKQLEGKEEIDWEAEVQTEPDSLYGDILMEQDAAEDSSSVTLYSNSDLLAAIGQYDNKNAKSLDPFKKMADAIVKSKVDEGKTQKEAAGSIKTSITSHYKPLWIAADRKGREEIQNVLKQLKVNGKALYTGEDWTNWNKAAKKMQKKQ